MFILDGKLIDELSEEGVYDYFTDIEDKRDLLPIDKETIYQYSLLYLQNNLNKSQIKEYLNGLNAILSSNIESMVDD